MAASNTTIAPVSGTQLTISGAISGQGGLSLADAGALILCGTTISAGTLQAPAASLKGSITDNARRWRQLIARCQRS